MSKKPIKTELEAAQELIRKQHEKDVQDCINEINESEKAILTKYGCVKGIRGQFVNNEIAYQITITKK